MNSLLNKCWLILLITLTHFNTIVAANPLSNPPQEVVDSIPNAQPMGSGTYRWFGLHIYDAQLWSNTTAPVFNYKRDPCWLELKYARNFDGADIARKSREQMAEMNIATREQLKSWEIELAEIFPDIQVGHTLGALYIPNHGLQFFRNGKPLARLDNEDLARSFMAIWLDPKTSAPELRKQLIGLNK